MTAAAQIVRLGIIAVAMLAVISLGYAQSAPAPAQPAPAAPAQATPPVQATPPLTRDGKPRAKEVRSGCRDEAKAQGLKPRDQTFRDHMRACIGKRRPDLVKAFDCRQEARDKKIEKAAIREYVKACRGKA